MTDRYLVTGGAGFIGRHVTAKLLAKGASVTVLDDGSAGLPLPTPKARLRVIQGDIRDRTAVETALEPGAAIIHLAALHHIPTCTKDPLRTLEINVVGTQILLDAAAKAATPRITLASSGAVYGWHEGPLAETAALAPSDIYGVSKRTNEDQAALWSQRTGASVRIARIFNAVGTGDPHGHLIPDILFRLNRLQDGALLLGTLTPRRDYLHVEDVADGLLCLADDPSETSLDIFNLCSGSALSVEEIARRLMAVAGISATIKSHPDLMRPMDRPELLGDPAKAQKQLDWTIRRSLEEALRAIVDQHLATATPS